MSAWNDQVLLRLGMHPQERLTHELQRRIESLELMQISVDEAVDILVGNPKEEEKDEASV